jgi:hypothetical protein
MCASALSIQLIRTVQSARCHTCCYPVCTPLSLRIWKLEVQMIVLKGASTRAGCLTVVPAIAAPALFFDFFQGHVMKKIQKINQALVGFRGSVLRFYNEGVHKPVQFWVSCGSPSWAVPQLPVAAMGMDVHRSDGLVPLFSASSASQSAVAVSALVALPGNLPDSATHKVSWCIPRDRSFARTTLTCRFNRCSFSRALQRQHQFALLNHTSGKCRN